jgi:hypothetical protein
MANGNNIVTSVHGRRLGLQPMSTAQTGATKSSPQEFIVGPEDVRLGVTTNESTATPMQASGVSYLVGTSAASTPVYQIAPPIPGVRKTIYFGSTDSAIYVRPSVTTHAFAGTSLGATGCGALRSSGGGYVELMGITTALYAISAVSSTAVNTVGFQATT